MKKLHVLTLVAAAALLAACGGGDVRTTAVKVVGDSLNDSGTFGFKFTVQGSPTLIWTDRVASAVGVSSLCARYGATSPTTVALNPAATACTSYAVGGGRVNPAGTAGDTTAFSIVQQLKDLAATGNFGSEELLLVDGGGNDAADLIGAYLGAAQDGGAAYSSLLLELLTPTAVQTAVAGGQSGLVAAGAQYMQALANRLADSVTAQALDKGAQRVVVVNAPDVTRTPRFTAVLAGVAAASGGGAAGQAAAGAVQQVARTWVQAFNAQLSTRLSSNSRVAIVDFYGQFNRWLDTPASFGLTNVTVPACPSTGTDSSGLPAYNLATCTATSLSASRPADPNWWQSYLFSDNFHATPKGNELFAQLVLDALASKGWR